MSFGTATTSDGSVVAWVARHRDGTTALKAAWVPWHGSVAGKVMVVAKGVGDLPPEPVARDDGRVWVVYADGNATPPGSPYPRSCSPCSIRARILSAAGPVGGTPVVTLAVPDGIVYEFHASARPDGGLLLWWWHQDQGPVSATNHVSTRAFDSQGVPLADERELLGGDYSLVAAADEGGALRVSFGESSEQGQYFQYLAGVQFDSDGAFLRGMELTPRSIPPVSSLEDFDVSRAAGGGYWLTWREAREGVKLWARRVTADGDLGPALVAGADPAAGPLAPTPDDGFLICHVSQGRLVARVHGEDARPRDRPLLLARGATSLFPLPLQLAVTDTGQGAVAWWGPPATDHSRALFLTRFTVSPGE
ncbi:MAG: hypothetical protein ACLGI9_14945 [Thermoanaerobaculia bacterium]